MKKWIIVTAIIACLILYFVEQIVEVNYVIKTGTKWALFLGIPLLLDKYIDKRAVEKQFHKEGLIFGFLFGLGSFAVVIGAYFLLQDFINFPLITNELQTKSKITAANFIFIAIYVTFGNSFLEEFFFRGFIFLNLKHLGSEKLAYFFSALLFALYPSRLNA